MEGPFKNQQIYTLNCNLVTMAEVQKFETLMKKMGIPEDQRPMKWAKDTPSKESGDPLAAVHIICVVQPCVHNVYIDSDYRNTEDAEIITAEQMYAVLQIMNC